MLETRWVRPVQAESLGNLYLIGCWRIIRSLSISVVLAPTTTGGRSSPGRQFFLPTPSPRLPSLI